LPRAPPVVIIEVVADESGFQMRDGSIPDRYDAHMWRFMEPHVAALVDAAAISPADTVLDVACGTGFVARATRARGVDRVVGADVNPAMLATARRCADAVNWVVASAQELPFDDGAFDVAVCSQGVQFFPEPAAGLREIARIAARLAITVWSTRARVPWFDAHIPMLARRCGVDAASMELSFSDETRVREWLAGTDLRADVTTLRTTATLPPGFSSDYLAALPWGRPFFELADDERERALADVEERLAEYRDPSGGLTVPFTAILVIAEPA
jgi:SAM-dependent methyltransferase